MTRSFGQIFVAVALVVFGVGNATAEDSDRTVMSISFSGVGTFAPVNFGVEGGRRRGVILGDGSGLSEYTESLAPGSEFPAPEGIDFRLDGQLQDPIDPLGPTLITDRHWGSTQTLTAGRKVGGNVVWPIEQGPNPIDPLGRRIHIMDTALGELHLWHFGKFTLSRTRDGGSSVVGNAWFFIVGGTGDFEGATGLTYCVVKNNVLLPPPKVLPTLPLPIAVPFDYEFYGFISVRDVD